MKRIILVLAAIITVMTSTAYGGYSTTGSCNESSYCTTSNCQQLGVATSIGCADYYTVYIGAYAYGYCGTCSPNYVSTTNTRAVPGTSCQITFTSCHLCPSPGIAGGSEITSCYIPAGSSFSDITGDGKYTGNCYYKQ